MKLSKRLKNQIIVILVITAWLFFGWPEISKFPPRIEKAASAGVCGFGAEIAGGQCRGYLTTVGSGTFTPPSDWSNVNKIEVLGGGGNGGNRTTGGGGTGGGGGGGGAYAVLNNTTLLTAGGSYSYTVGAANTGTSLASTTGSWFCNSTSNCAGVQDSKTIVGAESGAAASNATLGAGANLGTNKTYNGGAGGTGTNDSLGGGGGGGGAAGGTGGGGTGYDGVSYGGTGGTGDGGITAAKANGTEWSISPAYGSGGGGQGSAPANPTTAGGTYGAGGGGAGTASGATGGAGTQGIIVITYTPTPTVTRIMRLFQGYRIKLVSGRLIIFGNQPPCGNSISFGGLTYNPVNVGGQCFMDRNLGATQVATSSNDYLSYGSLYQWGRLSDGHQLITCTGPLAANCSATNGVTFTGSAGDTPPNSLFIATTTLPQDWRNSRNDTLWQSPDYVNNPCPSGWHVPLQTEWDSAMTTLGLKTCTSGCLVNLANSILKLPATGLRISTTGALNSQSVSGLYWSSSPYLSLVNSYYLTFVNTSVNPAAHTANRAYGMTVRCLRNY